MLMLKSKLLKVLLSSLEYSFVFQLHDTDEDLDTSRKILTRMAFRYKHAPCSPIEQLQGLYYPFASKIIWKISWLVKQTIFNNYVM